MFEQHLESLEKKLLALHPEEVLAFGLRCILRQLGAIKQNFPDFSEYIYIELVNKLEAVKIKIKQDEALEKFYRKKYDEAISSYINGVEYEENNLLAYEILGNIIDFLEACGEGDVEYVRNYSAYRNFSLVESLESYLFDDVADNFEDKNPMIQQFIRREIESQNSDIDVLICQSSLSSVRFLIESNGETPLFEL